MAEQSTSRRAAFAASSFANLRAAMGEGTGEPLRIALADIDEDPNQPRRTFDETGLQGLADTIRERGVLQPVGVLPPVDGRYILVFGARRLRASALAGKADIPAVIVPSAQRDYASQVIENQQRANLSNSEIAAAVNQLQAQGKQGRDIAAICNLKDYQLAAFRAVDRLPTFLRSRLDLMDIRAIYDLFRTWQKHPAAIEDAVARTDPSNTSAPRTVTDARRIIEAVTGKATGSLVIERETTLEADQLAAGRTQDARALLADIPHATLASDAAQVTLVQAGQAGQAGQAEPEQARSLAGMGRGGAPSANRCAQAPTASLTPVTPEGSPAMERLTLVVEWRGRHAVLVTSDKPATPGHVYLDLEGERQQALFTDIVPVEAR